MIDIPEVREIERDRAINRLIVDMTWAKKRITYLTTGLWIVTMGFGVLAVLFVLGQIAAIVQSP